MRAQGKAADKRVRKLGYTDLLDAIKTLDGNGLSHFQVAVAVGLSIGSVRHYLRKAASGDSGNGSRPSIRQ